MPLISEVVEAMTQYQNAGMKVLVFVVPVDPEALALSGRSAATVEDRVQNAMIAELNECLAPADPA